MRMYNDDLVMAFSIGCWVRDTIFEINKKELAYSRAFLGVMTKSSTTLNTTIDGMQGYKEIQKDDMIKQQEEFIWLLKG